MMMTVENIPWNISVRNVTIDEKFYRSGSVLIILILALMQCKIWNRFFTILSWPSRPIDLKLLQVCQFMLHYNVLTLPATGLLLKKKQFCNVPFRKIMKSLCYYSFFFFPPNWPGSFRRADNTVQSAETTQALLRANTHTKEIFIHIVVNTASLPFICMTWLCGF